MLQYYFLKHQKYLIVQIAYWLLYTCLLYTSDAADERSSVDLGGRRIIKKKRNQDSRQKIYQDTTQRK